MALVFAGICSHAPGITGRAERADPVVRDAFYAQLDRMRQAIENSGAEALVVIGISDDDIFGADVSLEPSIEVAYRGTWQTATPDLSFFWRASLARVEIDVSGFGNSASADETGFGLGIGGTWRGFTLGYTQYLGDLDDIDRLHIGYRFKTR